MPAASSSRRRRHREPSSDAIEEDQPDRGIAVEDVADADEGVVEAPRRSKKIAQAAPAQEDEDDEVQDLVATFTDQPLGKFELEKLKGVGSDWGMLSNQTHSSYFTLMNDVAATVAEFVDGDNGEKAMTDIDNVMKELINLEVELGLHEETIKDMVQRFTRGEQVDDITSYYKNGVKERVSAYKKKTTRQKYAKSEPYREFRQAIFDVQNPEEAMPPVTDLLPREDGDVSDDDDDVEVGGVTQDYKCPLTLTILEDPLTSSLCNHSFSAKAIMEYLGQKSFVECPASGCKSKITRSCLQPNKALAKRAKEAARRERARNDSDEESDEDEVIE